MGGTLASAPHPLLVRLPVLLATTHNGRLHIDSQVSLPLLLVLDQERFRVLALSVQRVLRPLVGLRLDGTDENNESNKLHGHDAWLGASDNAL